MLYAMAASASISDGWSLTVSEHGLLRMSLGKRSRNCGIAEVLRPLPVPDLGHILQLFTDIVVVALQFLVEEVDCMLRLQTKARDVLQCIERKMEAAHFVENHHVEWRGGRTTVHVAVHMEAALHWSAREPAYE